MTGWLVLGGAALLIALLPLGLELTWNGAGIRLGFRVGTVPLVQKDRVSAQNGKKCRLPSWPVLQIILKNGYPILCRLLSGGRVTALKLHFTAAFSDPAATAMVYAAAGTALEALTRLGEAHAARMDVKAMVDFERDAPSIDMHLAVSWRLYRLLYLAVLFGVRCWLDCLRLKKGDTGLDDGTIAW